MSLGTATGRIIIDGGNAVSSIGRIVGSLGNLSGSFSSGAGAAVAFGAALVAGVVISAGLATAALVKVVDASVEVASEFEAEMARVKAISGATGESFTQLSEAALELGSTTAFTAKQAAEGMGFLAMAGFETNEIIAAMPGVLSLAAATSIELGQAADITSNVLSAFGASASESSAYVDVLAKTVTSANTDMSGLAVAMEYAAPVANQLGVSVHELSAAIGLLGNYGIQGSKAGTALRASMTRLAAPTRKAKDLMEELGIQTIDPVTGKMLDFEQMLLNVRDATVGMSDEMKTATLKTLVGAEAMGSFMILLDEAASGSLARMTEELENSEGAAGEMAETMQDTLQGQVTALQSAIDGLKIAIGEQFTPILKDMAAAATQFVSDNRETIISFFQKLAEYAAMGGQAIQKVLSILTDGIARATQLVQTIQDKLGGVTVEDIYADYESQANQLLAQSEQTLGQLETSHQETVGEIQDQIALAEEDLGKGLANIAKQYGQQVQEVEAEYAENRAEIEEELAEAKAQAGAKIAKKQQALQEKLAGLEQRFAEKRASIQEQMSEKAVALEEKIADKRASLQEKVADMAAKLEEKKEAINRKIEDKIFSYEQQVAKDRAKLQEKLADMAAKFAQKRQKIETDIQDEIYDFEQKKEEIAQDLEADKSKESERFAKVKANLEKELAAATTEEEKANIQARLNAEQAAHDEKVKNLEEEAKTEEQKLQDKHDRAVQKLKDRLAQEEAAYQEQAAKEQARAEEELARDEAKHQRDIQKLNEKIALEEQAYQEKAAKEAARTEEEIARDQQKHEREIAKLSERMAQEEQKYEEAKQKAIARSEQEQAEIAQKNSKAIAALTERLAEEETKRQERLQQLAEEQAAEEERFKQSNATQLEDLRARLEEEKKLYAENRAEHMEQTQQALDQLEAETETRADNLTKPISEQFSGAAQGMTDFITKSTQKIKGFTENLRAWVEDPNTKEQISQMAKDLARGFLDTITGLFSDEEESNNIIVELLTALAEAAAAVGETVRMIGLSIATGIISALYEAITGEESSQEVEDGIYDALDTVLKVLTLDSELFDKWLEIGGNIIQGIIDGITENVGDIGTAISDGMDDALSFTEGFLEIGSPSKLVKRRLGVNLMPGAGEGILETTDSVKSALHTALDPNLLGVDGLREKLSTALAPNLDTLPPMTLDQPTATEAMAAAPMMPPAAPEKGERKLTIHIHYDGPAPQTKEEADDQGYLLVESLKRRGVAV